MKKATKAGFLGAIITAVLGAVGIVAGKKYMDGTLKKAIGPKIAGDDDMGAEGDPIIDVAKTL